MQGVFLHILADALGSVGVIVSSLLVQYKQWYLADPVCSFFVSMLILASVVPLLKSTTQSLMLRTPEKHEQRFGALMERLKRKTGVSRVPSAHLWRHSPKVLVCTVSVVLNVPNERDAVHIWLSQALKNEVGATDITVQVCTDAVQAELRA
jgi:zinc transporter 5/7